MTSVDRVMATIMVELANARTLLLMFEEASANMDEATSGAPRHVQGFDLALQILADLEYLTSLLKENIDTKQLSIRMPTYGLRLERLRASLEISDVCKSENKSESKPVDLF